MDNEVRLVIRDNIPFVDQWDAQVVSPRREILRAFVVDQISVMCAIGPLPIKFEIQTPTIKILVSVLPSVETRRGS